MSTKITLRQLITINTDSLHFFSSTSANTFTSEKID